MRPITRALLLLVIFMLLTVAPVIQAQERGENGCLPALGLAVGDEVTIIGGVYIRAAPTLDAGIVEYSPDRIAANIVGGPVCADGFNWWNVSRPFGEPDFLGWVAQGVPGKFFVLLNEDPSTEPNCPDPINVELNTAVATFTGIRVREEPSLQGRVLTVAQPDTTALVLEGPICNQGFNWWRVEIDVLDIRYNGWIVEGVAVPPEANDDPLARINDPLLLDEQPDAGPNSIACGPNVPLSIGAVGLLRFQGEPLKNLRGAPSTIGEVLYTLPSGITVEILGGPFCNEGVNWWRVQVRGGSVQPVGWLAEGDWLGRFLAADGSDYERPAP